jgi:hypothetical protein
MFAYTRAALSLEQAAKSAAEMRDARSTAHHLGKAERLILKSSFNTPQVQALNAAIFAFLRALVLASPERARIRHIAPLFFHSFGPKSFSREPNQSEPSKTSRVSGALRMSAMPFGKPCSIRFVFVKFGD